MSERNLLAISIKHTEHKWKFGKPCVLWGHRTRDDEPRSFAGYTTDPREAEMYSIEDWKNSGYASAPWMKVDKPVNMCVDLCKRYREYDTVLVFYTQYIAYCAMSCILPKGD